MLKTLRLSFSLKNTYRVNSILYAIKQIPLLKKIIPDTVYQILVFKVIANVLSVIWEILSIFLGKILYFLIMIIAASALYNLPDGDDSQLFLHLLLFLSIIGCYVRGFMFDPTTDKYYAMILLGLNAREYTLINYFYAILKVLVGFTLCSFMFGLLVGLSMWQCVIVPFFVAGVKLSASAFELRRYERIGTVNSENKLSRFDWLAVVLLLAAAYGLPTVGFMLPEFASISVMCVGVILGVLSIRKILTFKYYRAMQKELLAEITTQIDSSVQVKSQQEQSLKNISTDNSITSVKKGFEYMNDLFIKRHRKILWSSVKKIAAAALILIAGVLIIFQLIPDMKESVNGMMMTSLPYFVFVMYIVNRGTGFTRALFINCDHSLLTYSFYKQPKFILKLFQIRLREIIKVNLLPATVIGAGLVILLFASGGTDNILNYIVLFVSVIALSIFFSVHYLTLYYLLQPYNAGTEIKSGTYQFFVSLTYIICYYMIQVEMTTLVFGIMTIIFCVLYCLTASILVYKLAPKTFRIRT